MENVVPRGYHGTVIKTHLLTVHMECVLTVDISPVRICLGHV